MHDNMGGSVKPAARPAAVNAYCNYRAICCIARVTYVPKLAGLVKLMAADMAPAILEE